MGNSLQQDLTGKVIAFAPDRLRPGLDPMEHVFYVTGGFGASAHTRGTALMGVFLSDGERCRMEGWDVGRIVEEDELTDAQRAVLKEVRS